MYELRLRVVQVGGRWGANPGYRIASTIDIDSVGGYRIESFRSIDILCRNTVCEGNYLHVGQIDHDLDHLLIDYSTNLANPNPKP